MYIREVVVDGFKSYATRTVIAGWDPRFNAITGLNGSGKSNVLDALCFVLGIERLAAVRAASMQDLVYKRGQAGVTRASVTVVFDNSDRARAPVGYADAPEVTVTRQVSLAGRSRYLVNGHVATQHAVENLFQSVQLNVNNPHFLIMQGQITRVLSMRPQETLSLIEESAGTRMFEDHKARAAATLAKKEAKIAETEALLAEAVEPRLAVLRKERADLLAYQRTEAEAERLERAIAVRDYVAAVSQRENAEAEVRSAEAAAADAERSAQDAEEAHAQADAALDALVAQRRAAGTAALRGLEDAVRDATNAALRLEAQCAGLRADVVAEGEALSCAEAALAASEAALPGVAAASESCQMRMHDAAARRDALAAEARSLSDLLGALQTGVDATGASGYAQMLAEAQDRASAAAAGASSCALRLSSVSTELSGLEGRISAAERATAALRARLAAAESRVSDLNTRASAAGEVDSGESEELKREAARLRNALNEARRTADGLRGRVTAATSFAYAPESGVSPGAVRGVVAGLVELSPEVAARWGTALEVAAGARLHNVVVARAADAAALLERGGLTRRTTFVPLDAVQARAVDAGRVAAAAELTRGRAALAQSLVGFPADAAAAAAFVFGGTFVAEGREDASLVAFDRRVGVRAVTAEGDLYEPAGLLSGGSSGGQASSLLAAVAAFRAAEAAVSDVSARLAALEPRLAQAQAAAGLADELRAAGQELVLVRRALEADADAAVLGRRDALLAERARLHAEVERLKQAEREALSDAQRVQRDMAELAADRGGKLAELRARSDALRGSLRAAEDEAARLSAAAAHDASLFAAAAAQRDAHAARVSELRARVSSLGREADVVARTHAEAAAERDGLAARLDAEAAHVRVLDAALADAREHVRATAEQKAGTALEHRRAVSALESSKSSLLSASKTAASLLRRHPWLAEQTIDAADASPATGADADRRLAALCAERDALRRRVNHAAADVLAALEERHGSLSRMLAAVRRDKATIEGTVAALSAHQAEALERTFAAVNDDFGALFGEMLPGCAARLETPDAGTAPLSAGLEIRVRLGAAWRAGLSELSGGQRSLVALALILALLRFKPAPVYILDEVDAALDLAHTAAIGRILRSPRFAGAQFVVVSLKEGMFACANVLFRTRFRDGVSSIERVAAHEADAGGPAEDAEAEAKKAPAAPRRAAGRLVAA